LLRNEHTGFMASAFQVTAGNNHFGKSDALFHSPRVVGGAHVKSMLFDQVKKWRCPTRRSFRLIARALAARVFTREAGALCYLRMQLAGSLVHHGQRQHAQRRRKLCNCLADSVVDLDLESEIARAIEREVGKRPANGVSVGRSPPLSRGRWPRRGFRSETGCRVVVWLVAVFSQQL